MGIDNCSLSWIYVSLIVLTFGDRTWYLAVFVLNKSNIFKRKLKVFLFEHVSSTL